jgi:hypothetical protein
MIFSRSGNCITGGGGLSWRYFASVAGSRTAAGGGLFLTDFARESGQLVAMGGFTDCGFRTGATGRSAFGGPGDDFEEIVWSEATMRRSPPSPTIFPELFCTALSGAILGLDVVRFPNMPLIQEEARFDAAPACLRVEAAA